MNTSNSETRAKSGPFVILTIIYFIVGFLTTINGQFQGPMKVAFLAQAHSLRNTLATLISFFFFLGYLVNSGTGGRWVNKHGYKATMVRALAVMGVGGLVYALSSWTVTAFPSANVPLGDDIVPVGYFVFLLASFLVGSAAAILQVAINPYCAAYPLKGTSAVQRMNIGTGVNSVGTTIGPFFVTGVIFAGVAIEAVSPNQLILPFVIIAVVIFAVSLTMNRMHLPDLAGTRINTESQQTPKHKITDFRHLILGITAIFFYVGTEVCIGVNVNLHAMQMIQNGHPLSFFGNSSVTLFGLQLGIPALLATLYWGGMMVGRLTFGAVKSVSPRALLIVTTTIAATAVLLAMLLDNLWILVSVGLLHSVMWGCIFTLAVAGLGEYTGRASGLFMMGVFGGAVFPVVQAIIADSVGSWQWTWTVCLVCELVMLAYGLIGSRVTHPYALRNIHMAPSDPG